MSDTQVAGTDAPEDTGLSGRFESAEHNAIGARTMLTLANGERVSASKHMLRMRNGMDLTLGQIACLAGDYYGVPDHPISDATVAHREQCFMDAFATLDNGDPDEIQTLLGNVASEAQPIIKCLVDGVEPSSTYEGGHSITHNLQLNKLTKGRYFKLLETNWDHFGARAWDCYVAGHACAIDIARDQHGGLTRAYAVEAYALHYLTDLFAGGHLRVPRKEVCECAYQYSDWQDPVTDFIEGLPLPDVVKTALTFFATAPEKMAAMCTNAMHDEDCHWGLLVENRRGDRWRAYGDKRYFDSVNWRNAELCEETVQASVDHLYQAFKGGQSDNPVASMVLDLSRLGGNHPAMLKHVPSSASPSLVREEVNNPNCMTYTYDWWHAIQYFKYGRQKEEVRAKLPPTNYLATPTQAPRLNSWSNSGASYWTQPGRVRWAIANTSPDGSYDSARGPWSAWETIEPGRTASVNCGAPASSLRVWRHIENVGTRRVDAEPWGADGFLDHGPQQ